MKIKFSIKSTFKYLYLTLILVNTYLIYLTYDFADTNVYKTMFPDENISMLENRKYSEDLDVNNFNKIIDKIKQKSNPGASISTPLSINQSTSTVDNTQ
jgi:hypothetical protein